MKIKIIALLSIAVLLGACSDSEYDLEKLVPQEYHKILYMNNSGKQPMVLYDTEEDNRYTFSVFKSGSHPDQPASVDIRVLSQLEVDTLYGEPENANYKVIDPDSYSLETSRLDFTASDRYKIGELLLKPQAVKALLASDPEAVWVLPLIAVSETDSVNAEMNQIFLQILGVISPAIGFTNPLTGIEMVNHGAGTVLALDIEVSLDTDNLWDLEYGLEVDEEYVGTYNTQNGTVFALLPEGAFAFDELNLLPSGTTRMKVNVAIESAELAPGDYMLPIRIGSISQFEIAPSSAVYPLKLRVMAPRLERTGWTAEASSEELSGEGPDNGSASSVLDGSISTYWHSRWSNGTDGFPHEIIVDTQAEHLISQISLRQRQNEGYMDTRAGEFFVSTDKQEWVKVGEFSMERIFDEQVFAITPMQGRYVKIKINSGYREPYCSLSDVHFYGLK